MLQPAGLVADTWFGEAVAIDGDRIVVGAPRDDQLGADVGSVYVYQRGGAGWMLDERLLPDAGAFSYGTGVALDGPHAGVLSFVSDGVVSSQVDVYARSGPGGAAWRALHRLFADEPGTGFGLVGLAGRRAFVSKSLGEVHVADFSALFPSTCDGADGALAACPCANPGAPESGCDLAQSTGGVALSVLAQETLARNRATFRGTGFPAMGAPAVLAIRSSTLDPAAPVVFGNGVRCIGPAIVRLTATFAAGGGSEQTVGHGASAGSGAFAYQLWFRDTPAMFCTPEAFNLSNACTLVW